MGGGPKGYRSDTGGVIPMNIGGRMINQRERLFNMTDEERAWRNQFLKDQKLAPNEPLQLPEVYKELNNPIRRFYKAPLNKFQAWLAPRIGPAPAEFTRNVIGKGTIAVLFGLYSLYYLTYQRNTWERRGGWRFYGEKPLILPGHPEYPNANLDKPGSFYIDEARGFSVEKTPNF